jgi:hypothetical protein
VSQTPATTALGKNVFYYCQELVWEAKPNGDLVKVFCFGVYWPGFPCAFTIFHQPRKDNV